jgi:hypothetical protein
MQVCIWNTKFLSQKVSLLDIHSCIWEEIQSENKSNLQQLLNAFSLPSTKIPPTFIYKQINKTTCPLLYKVISSHSASFPT